MEYLLSVGLSFETAQESLEMLKMDYPEIFKTDVPSEDLKRLMILMSPNKLELQTYDAEDAFLRVNRLGLPLVPFWGDRIHKHLRENLGQFKGKLEK